MTVRAAEPGDSAAIRQVHEEAFGQPNEARLVEALPWVISLVAVDGFGEVVGHVLLAGATLDSGAPVLTLGPIGVQPDRQRGGHGAALMHEAIDRARATPYAAIVLVGDPAYYSRFGFSRADEMGIACPFADVPPEAWLALRLPAWDDSVRGTVVYPAPWAEV